ncbi:hypothetical protein RF679_13270 [Undibacterium cyanobacteriorum]|uniref:Uncharacterized protein n=1 Tax=Undibacterium cyanobacteriorum TaxID=3073561 RepID=A0ABY9RHP4_9BURK|nr:hypothetical protein [Undibacterium sp. 20NA77.5]WMW79616.1 hypothetical protein RF679_13270 [Undibacterium sp. 20NA77.5]
MDAREVITLIAIYIAIYYFNAKRLLSWIRDFDKEYSESLGFTSGFGMSDSMAVGKILFDKNLPKATYPNQVKFRFKLTRLMLFLSPVFVLVTVALNGLIIHINS